MFLPKNITKQKKYNSTLQVSLCQQTKTSLIALLTHHQTHFIKLDMNKKLTKSSLGLCFHNHLWFGQKKSSIHRERIENIPALLAVFTCCWCSTLSRLSATSCLFCPRLLCFLILWVIWCVPLYSEQQKHRKVQRNCHPSLNFKSEIWVNGPLKSQLSSLLMAASPYRKNGYSKE